MKFLIDIFEILGKYSSVHYLTYKSIDDLDKVFQSN